MLDIALKVAVVGNGVLILLWLRFIWVLLREDS
jgi:hypothetical protein